MQKNKYSGSDFDDFLKEEGIYEEVKALAQKELETLHNGNPEDASEITEDSLGRLVRFFQWLRHAINL